jgi:hypothetical protein
MLFILKTHLNSKLYSHTLEEIFCWPVLTMFGVPHNNEMRSVGTATANCCVCTSCLYFRFTNLKRSNVILRVAMLTFRENMFSTLCGIVSEVDFILLSSV